ncbi:MAG: cupin domain-containing protein [Granulosicoccus sp.]
MKGSALSTILGELRVSGAIVLSQAHPIPWSIRVPRGNTLRPYLGVSDDVTVVPFHIAHRGHFDLITAKGKSITVQSNQMVMCANGQGHVMGSGEARQTRSFEEVMSGGSFHSPASETGNTEVVCGVFMLRNTKHNPMIMALPDFVLIDVFGSDSSHTMQQLHAMLKDELSKNRQAQSYMLERVLELMYAESIRLYTEMQHTDSPGWLSAIRDSRIGPAISYIHDNLTESITIDQLAQLVALSPSRFAALFKASVGISPKAYIGTQRQALAARRLLESKLSIQEIAHECGYRSMPSFSKLFLKQFGCTPSQWRRQGESEIC